MDIEYHKIRPIIDCFDKMREILRNEDIDMPKIVVVGDQSSGKSSVLESITGLGLPRGQNTVTRCPMVIQLKRANKKSEEFALVWIEGDDVNSTSRCVLEDLSNIIVEKQKFLIEKEKVEITTTAINIKVHRINAPELTLYDLPGITYKNEKLIGSIREIIKKYTAGCSTIILMVIPANCDLTTSEALSIVKQQKDFKNRTIAVVTKIDLSEKGIFEKITSNELELKFDPIVVRNRTQDEIDKNEDWNEIRTKEIELLNTNEELKKLSDDSKGTTKLVEKLILLQRTILVEATKNVEEQIDKKILETEEELKKMALPVNTVGEKIDRFKSCLRKMINLLNTSMENNVASMADKEYNIQARLREKFDKFNKDFMSTKNTIFTKTFCDKVEFMVKEARGLLLQNFLDPKVFSIVILREIKNGMEKYKTLVKEVYEYLNKILQDFCKMSFEEFPNLLKNINIELGNENYWKSKKRSRKSYTRVDQM